MRSLAQKLAVGQAPCSNFVLFVLVAAIWDDAIACVRSLQVGDSGGQTRDRNRCSEYGISDWVSPSKRFAVPECESDIPRFLAASMALFVTDDWIIFGI